MGNMVGSVMVMFTEWVVLIVVCYSSGKVGRGVDEVFVVRGAWTIVGIALVCEITERVC